MNRIYVVVAPKLSGGEMELARYKTLDEAKAFLRFMCGEEIDMFMHHFIRTIQMTQGVLNNNSTLFEEGGEYYDVTMIITPTRIGKSYKAGTFRDVHLKKNKKGEYMFL